MNVLYDEEKIENIYAEITQTLISKGLTVTTMESATGGLISSLLTDTPGASAVLKGAFVTYCNEAKVMQGVSARVIEKYSVYSEQTACAMAQACRQTYNADIGVGVTGTLGNIDPDNSDYSVPGNVFFSFCRKDKTDVFTVQIMPQPTRLMYKLAVAEKIGTELLRLLKNM